MVSDKAKSVLIAFQENEKYRTQDEALSELLERYGEVLK